MTEETIPLIDSKKYHKEEIVGFKICFRAFTKDPTMRDAEFDVGISNENKIVFLKCLFAK